MELQVVKFDTKEPLRTTKSADILLASPFKEALVHQVVTQYLTNSRSGTKAQKSRSMVRGGGVKPWRQKGTGRARAGTIRSPLWRGGGVTFAAQPKDFKTKINHKMYVNAIRSIFSELARQNRLMIVDEITVLSPKTKQFTQKLSNLGLKKVLIVVSEVEKNLELATRNIPHLKLCDKNSVDPVSLIRYEQVVLTEPVLEHLKEVFA